MKKTLSFRLSIRFMTLVAAIVLLVASLFVFVLRFSIYTNQSKVLLENANLLAEELKNEENPVLEALPLDYFVSFVIFDDAGQIYYTNDSLIPELELTDGKSKRYFQKDFYSDGDLNLLYCSKKIELGANSGEIGSGNSAAGTNNFSAASFVDDVEKPINLTIQTSIDIAQDYSIKMVNFLPKVVLVAIIPILIISFLISLLITKRTLKPVEKITKAAQGISSKNLKTLLPVSKNDDELDNLAKTFNQLFENLRKDFEREAQFSSDVSHELKTPVAGILGQANLLKRWGKDDPKQLDESLDLIINEAKSMESIITVLLQASKIEHGIIKPILSDVNMWGMFSRLKNEFAVVAPQVQTLFDENVDVALSTDMELLHQVLTALMSNSVKFGAKVIELKAVKTAEGKIEIAVEDDGPGFSEEILPHVFERFFRGDKSHNRSSGGAGLGLSISATIIKALGGTISAKNCTTHQGARIVICLK